MHLAIIERWEGERGSLLLLTHSSLNSYGIDTRGPVITEMSCATGSELTALQCAYSDSSDISNTCVDSSDLVVTCCEL